METEKMMIIGLMIVIIAVGLVIGVAMLAATIPSGGDSGGSSSSSLTPDTDLIDEELAVPDWGLLMSDEEVVQMSDIEGQFVIVDLMGLNCPACETQNDEFKDLIEDMGDSIILISLSVDSSTTASQMANYKEEHELTWYHGLDTNGVFSNYFSIRFTPTVIIIDDDGYFRMYHEGVWDSDDIQEQISLMDR